VNIFHVFPIAIGLAMDAFAVSVGAGMALETVSGRERLKVALYFGVFQGCMPVIGWLAGQSVRRYITSWDHWVAFGLLMAIGLKMLLDPLRKKRLPAPEDVLKTGRMLLLSLATSMDALAVGVSFAMLGVEIWAAAILIGIVTGVLCAVGIEIGEHAGAHLGKSAEIAGGAVLCFIGAKILLEHLM